MFEAVLKSGSPSYGKYWKLKFHFRDFKSHGSLDFLADDLKKIEDICVKHQNTVGWYSSGSVTSVNFEIKGLSKSHGPLFRSTSKAIILQRN